MNVLVFGATGSAGSSVLDVCFQSSQVSSVKAITRRTLGMKHEKLTEYIHDDYSNYSTVTNAFANVDAVMFCLGTSSTQVREESKYRAITVEYPVAAMRELLKHSPNAVFHYVSGVGTTADGRSMWSRVKAEAENTLMSMGKTVCYRPAFIDAKPSKSEPWYATVAKPMFKLFKPFKSLYVSGVDLGTAMIATTLRYERSVVLSNAEIRSVADKYRKG